MWPVPQIPRYRVFVPRYHDIVEHMSSGPSLVMEVRQENAVDGFRRIFLRERPVASFEPRGIAECFPQLRRNRSVSLTGAQEWSTCAPVREGDQFCGGDSSKIPQASWWAPWIPRSRPICGRRRYGRNSGRTGWRTRSTAPTSPKMDCSRWNTSSTSCTIGAARRCCLVVPHRGGVTVEVLLCRRLCRQWRSYCVTDRRRKRVLSSRGCGTAGPVVGPGDKQLAGTAFAVLCVGHY